MNLEEIQNPDFLKRMNTQEMAALADDIRRFLISSISKTGGHLASNLGVVELTIALHYVFNSPTDKLIFDVGHQTYTHKILTGRASLFPSLRKYKGMSGFQKRCESPHDIWEAGHSSTSLSAALGMAVARDLDGKNYNVISIIGDGALSSGMALEALNQIGSEGRKLVIVFNDNKMSISRNVGALTSSFSRLRASKGYNIIKRNMKRNLRSNDFGEAVYSRLKAVKDIVKDAIIDGGIFEQFNLDYIGPIDGHNIPDLIKCLSIAKDHDGPIVVHVITKKGKGYAPCENDRIGMWHGIGPFNPENGQPLHSVPKGFQNWSNLMSNTVADLANENKNIIAVSPAMVYGSGLQQFFSIFPSRSFDTGIAEEHAATFSAGLAISGKRPYLEIYSSFLQRAYDQINHDICRMDLPVVIGIDRAGLVGADGDTHHGIFDIGLLRALPNIIIAQPSNAAEGKNLLYSAFTQSEHPYAIRFPKGEILNPIPHQYSLIKTGTWQKFNDKPENKVVIFTYGAMVEKTLGTIIENNLPYTVVNCRFIKPLDTEMLEDIANSGIPMVIYETDMLACGLGSAILEYLGLSGKVPQLRRYGIDDKYVPHGSENQLRKELGIDIECLMNDIGQWIEGK